MYECPVAVDGISTKDTILQCYNYAPGAGSHNGDAGNIPFLAISLKYQVSC